MKTLHVAVEVIEAPFHRKTGDSRPTLQVSAEAIFAPGCISFRCRHLATEAFFNQPHLHTIGHRERRQKRNMVHFSTLWISSFVAVNMASNKIRTELFCLVPAYFV